MKWGKVDIETKDGDIEGIAPDIISASRSTDIPAFYGKWLMNRIEEGYVKWTNPFNANQVQYISFEKTRLFVFWSKDPKSFIPYLDKLDQKGINYYFQFTVNDYEKENFEPNVPKLNERIRTFKELSEKIGKEKVIWRFDPLILTDTLGVSELLDKVESVGDEINQYTEKCVFSFVDLSYRKVINNLKRLNISYSEFDEKKMYQVAEELQKLQQKWSIDFSTCAETVDLCSYGITHNSCVDRDLIIRLFEKDTDLMDFLGHKAAETSNEFLFEKLSESQSKKEYKDKGQRKECGCVFSKDIGKYDTCGHLCVYCYANSSKTLVQKNINRHSVQSESIV